MTSFPLLAKGVDAAPLRTNLGSAGRLADEPRKAADQLSLLAGLADMERAMGERSMKEEASAFLAFIAETAARPDAPWGAPRCC